MAPIARCMILQKKPILVVEDDPNDVFFLQNAFDSAQINLRLQVVSNVEEAIQYFCGEGKYVQRQSYPLPWLTLLDLKLPGAEGLELLRWLQKDPDLRMALVVVLTSSKDPRDVAEAYRLGARSYLVKPISVATRVEMVKTLQKYWFEFNELPPEGHL